MLIAINSSVSDDSYSMSHTLTILYARLGRLRLVSIFVLIHSSMNRFKVLNLCGGVLGGTFLSPSAFELTVLVAHAASINELNINYIHYNI